MGIKRSEVYLALEVKLLRKDSPPSLAVGVSLSFSNANRGRP